jgi:glucose/arabinose dehydrogenase
MNRFPSLASLALCVMTIPAAWAAQTASPNSVYADWSMQKPGSRHKVTVADLPKPAQWQAVNMTPYVIERPEGAWPTAPTGFKVTLYAGGNAAPMERAQNVRHMQLSGGTFTMPRLMETAPNGDIFLADSGAGVIFVMRGVTADGKAAQIAKFAEGLDHPFGIAFYPAKNPRWVYVGCATTIQKFPYKVGDMQAGGPAQTVVPNIPGYAQLMGGGHWTRDVVFTRDDKYMLVSVGSASNIDNPDTHPREFHRADILEYTPEGKFIKVYAHGIRNCVGEAINPVTGSLWCSTNERDDLGDHLPPDYVTSIKEDGFYGWPWYYIGDHRDPRLPLPCADGTGANPQRTAPLTEDQGKDCKPVDLGSKVIVPDVLVQPHMASLEMTFYPNSGNFPAQYNGGIFAAEHGSWNRLHRAGYEVIWIPMQGGHPVDGSYEDFLTGFVTAKGQVWGRPVGVTVGPHGALYVSDDGSRSVWRVAYTGK